MALRAERWHGFRTLNFTFDKKKGMRDVKGDTECSFPSS